MTPKQLRDEFRRLAGDFVDPYLWSDSEVYGYLLNAERQAAEMTGGIRDSQSSLATLDIGEGEEFVELDARILRVFRARTSERNIDIISAADPRALALPLAGTLTALVAGEDDTGLRPVYIPNADETVLLTIARLPLAETMTATSTFEIRSEFHYPLVYGALEQAYGKDDADAYDRRKLELNAAKFRAEITRLQASLDKRRHAPRTVAYGGL